MNREPNFFILGAPKSGTTSLAYWLSAHPRAFVARMKEPCFFNVDVGHRNITSDKQYLSLFDEADRHHIAVGEASTSYLRSKQAVPGILARFPSAKFIVMLRSPVDLVLSLHQQEAKTLNEDLPFEEAWLAQAERAAGRRIPFHCRDASLLMYRERALLGTQLQSVCHIVRPESLKILVFEDLTATPRRVYRDTLSFLGLDDDGRTDFAAQNPRAEPKSKIAEVALGAVFQLKRFLGITGGTGFLRPIANWNRRPVEKPTIREATRRELIECFRPEVEVLSTLVGRDFRSWLE